MRKVIKNMLFGLLIVIILIAIDQITKAIVRSHFERVGQSIKVIGNFFKLTYVQNQGGAWGILSGKKWFFIIITILALFIFGYFMKDFDLKNKTLYSLGLALMVGGTIGNFIDRLFFDYVTDFLDFVFFGWDFPVFNFADICLTIGVVLLLIHVLLGTFHGESAGI